MLQNEREVNETLYQKGVPKVPKKFSGRSMSSEWWWRRKV